MMYGTLTHGLTARPTGTGYSQSTAQVMRESGPGVMASIALLFGRLRAAARRA